MSLASLAIRPLADVVSRPLCSSPATFLLSLGIDGASHYGDNGFLGVVDCGNKLAVGAGRAVNEPPAFIHAHMDKRSPVVRDR